MSGLLGTAPFTGIYSGPDPILKAYLGTQQVWAPNSGAPVEYVTGAVARNGSSGSNRSCSTSVNADTADDVYMLVLGAISHENWLNSIGAYGTMTVSSHLDGDLTYLGGIQNGSSGSRQGAALAWGKKLTTLGASHTVNMYVQSPSQWVNAIEFAVLIYKNVIGPGAVITATQNNVVAAPSIPFPASSAQDRVVLGLVSDPDITTVTSGTTRQHVGAGTDGRGDYLTALELPGSPAGVTFAASTAARHCAIGVNLIGYAA